MRRFSAKTPSGLEEVKVLKFQTAPTPSLKEIMPKGTNVLSKEKIQLLFEGAMDKKSVEEGFSLSPEAEGTFEWSDDGTRMSFITNDQLKKETTYKISLKGTIKSIYGAKLNQDNPESISHTHEFTTIGSVGVAKTSPAAGSFGVNPGSSVSISFNQEVDKKSAESKISFSPAVQGSFSWNETTVTFKPSNSLKAAQKYTITVAQGVKSIDGVDLKSGYTFSFTT